jgi:hypothetical protein
VKQIAEEEEKERRKTKATNLRIWPRWKGISDGFGLIVGAAQHTLVLSTSARSSLTNWKCSLY